MSLSNIPLIYTYSTGIQFVIIVLLFGLIILYKEFNSNLSSELESSVVLDLELLLIFSALDMVEEKRMSIYPLYDERLLALTHFT